MSTDPELERVPLDGGFVMRLRADELESVSAGLGKVDTSALPAALRAMPSSDRAAFWELAVRHYGRHKSLEQAAAEIGMDRVRGEALVEAFSQALAAIG
jgi:hypothetical protein